MATDILDVIKNIQSLYENDSSLAALKDFERVIDELDLYVYDNWIDGELAYGPKINRHWIAAGFMWPVNQMPDPTGAKRLLDLGCKVKYQRSHLVEPREIRTPADIRPGSKKGKLDRKKIWIVEIHMPRKVAFDVYKGYMSKMKGEIKSPVANETITNTPSPMAPGMTPGGAAPMPPTAAPQTPAM